MPILSAVALVAILGAVAIELIRDRGHTSGDLALALGLGIVLMALSLGVNGAAFALKEAAERRLG